MVLITSLLFVLRHTLSDSILSCDSFFIIEELGFYALSKLALQSQHSASKVV